MRLSLNELVPESITLENDRFDNIVENVDDVNLSDREIELEATLVHEIEIESRDEPLEVAIFIEMKISADDLEYDSLEECIHASGLRASSESHIYQSDNEKFSEQELLEIKTFVE
jgi:hypothetical protein